MLAHPVLRQKPGTARTIFCAAVSKILGRADNFKIKPAFAAMHGPHSGPCIAAIAGD